MALPLGTPDLGARQNTRGRGAGGGSPRPTEPRPIPSRPVPPRLGRPPPALAASFPPLTQPRRLLTANVPRPRRETASFQIINNNKITTKKKKKLKKRQKTSHSPQGGKPQLGAGCRPLPRPSAAAGRAGPFYTRAGTSRCMSRPLPRRPGMQPSPLTRPVFPGLPSH